MLSRCIYPQTDNRCPQTDNRHALGLAAHVHRFIGSLLPPCFESANQDADPFLHELYRRVGAVDVLHDVRVLNAIGGAVGPEKYTPPRYDRLRPSRAAVDQLYAAFGKGSLLSCVALARRQSYTRLFFGGAARDGSCLPPPPVQRCSTSPVAGRQPCLSFNGDAQSSLMRRIRERAAWG